MQKRRKIYIVLIALIIMIGGVFFSSTQTQADEIQEASTKLDKLSTEYNDALMRKEQIEQELTTTNTQVEELQQKHDKLKKELDNYSVYVYKHGADTLVKTLLESTDLTQTIQKLDLLTTVSANNAETLKEVEETTSKLSQEKEKLDTQHKEIEEQTQKAAQAKQQAEEELANLKLQTLMISFTPESYDEAMNNPVVKRAYESQGIPYVWGGCSPTGFDCSGLVSYCLTGQYKRIGTTTTFMGWQETTTPQPGDVISTDSHCGIYIGGNKMIHAPQTGDVVRVTTVDWMLRRGAKFVKYPG